MAAIAGVVGMTAGYYVKIYGNTNLKTKTGYNCVHRAAENEYQQRVQPSHNAERLGI